MTGIVYVLAMRMGKIEETMNVNLFFLIYARCNESMEKIAAGAEAGGGEGDGEGMKIICNSMFIFVAMISIFVILIIFVFVCVINKIFY